MRRIASCSLAHRDALHGHPRGGFTLAEILVAMSLTLAIFAITLPFVRVQTQALAAGAGRLDADQLARYAQRAIDRDLRVAASVQGQPLLVFAGPRGLAFSANLVAADTSDRDALELVSGAPESLAESWRPADAARVAAGTRSYPTLDYLDGAGVRSRHETIAFFLHPDTIAGRSDDYVLWRRVNARDSVAIVRALQLPTDSAFFSYHRPVAGVMTRIAAARLPLYWDSTAIDSVRSVGISATGMNRDRRTGSWTLRTVRWEATLTNATTRNVTGCGTAPGQPPTNQFSVRNRDGGVEGHRVQLTWDDSPDDAGGERDVLWYLVERRRSGTSTYLAIASVPARQVSNYEWHHAAPTVWGWFEYTVRAVDRCGQVSARTTEAAVPLP